MNTTTETPVLITGGGIVGLSAALFLLQQGITPLLVERHRGTSIHPRARGFDIRSMELYRQLGVSEAVRMAGKALGPSWGILTGTSLAGALGKVKRRPGQKKGVERMPGVSSLAAFSPETGARCTQDLAEPVLLAAARERGADLRFHTEMTGFTQDRDGVTATIRDRSTGTEQQVRAAYMIAADGARSPVREALQAAVTGRGALANLLNIYFEADLEAFVRDREFSIMLIKNDGLRGMLTAINNSNRWVFHLHYDPAAGTPGTERLTEILHQVTGLPGIPVRIISVLPWQPTVKVVNDMQHGRVFLAGDAAHVMTPYGGKGANTGIQDVHNLAWKLAAVIKGIASPALLRTYSAERQPVGLFNALSSGKWADGNGLLKKNIASILGMAGTVMCAGIATAIGLHKTARQLAMRHLAGMIGLPDYQYSSPAIAGSVRWTGYRKAADLAGAPGTRLPHIWVEQDGRRISTLDLVAETFVLFTGTDNTAWRSAAAYLHIPVYSIGTQGDLVFTGQSLQSIYGITAAGAVLVRPDGFVVWRCRTAPAAAEEELKQVMEHHFTFSNA